MIRYKREFIKYNSLTKNSLIKNTESAPPTPSATTSKKAIQEVKKKACVLLGTRSVFNKRHDKHLSLWIANLGLQSVLDSLDNHNFESLDYFYSEVNENVCLWEQMFLRRQESEYEEKREEYNQPIFKEL